MPKLTAGGARQSSAEKMLHISGFLGVDLTTSTANVDLRRSADAPNMMPGADGFPVKRPGFKTQCTLSGEVHAAYALVQNEARCLLVHAGTTLYRVTENAAGCTATPLCTDMADAPSSAVQLGGKLWILDGKTYRCYDGTSLVPVSSIATVPKITVAKAPNGSATAYLPVNLLTGWRTDSFRGAANTLDYYTSFQSLTPAAVKARVRGADGVWKDLSEKTQFSVERTLGRVRFVSAPGASPVAGEDNVEITYETENDAVRINRLRFSILYGVNGALDRVFMSGDPTRKNVDYWSEYADPAYIGDVNYAELGQESSPIVGYSVLGGSLVTHKIGEENGRNAFVRTGSLDADGFAGFTTVNVVQGEGACSVHSFASLNSEPMFLTPRGVYALTPSDVTGERYAQCRSYYLNGALQRLTAAQMGAACACVWGRFYVLAAAGTLYLMDGDRKSYEERSPYSSFQYESWQWQVPATCVWVEGGALWVGTREGAVRKLLPGTQAADYADDGRPYVAHWNTPLSSLGVWGSTKTVTGVWAVCKPYTRSSATLSYASDRDEKLQVCNCPIDILDWNDIDFGRFTFQMLDRPAVVASRRKARKVKLFGVCVENAVASEPFGLLALQINFRLGDKIR